MFTIHGRINSINVQKAVLICEELKLPYQRLDAGGVFGIVSTPEYKALNPNALVPVLIDGDLVLWESNAIVRYVAAQYGAGTVWPTDPKVRALSDRWMDWASTTFYPAFHAAFFGLVRTAPENRDKKLIDESIAKATPILEILENELRGKMFLAGDRPTIGDIAVLPAAFRWLNMPMARAASPAVEAWVARMTSRPGYGNALLLPVT